MNHERSIVIALTCVGVAAMATAFLASVINRRIRRQVLEQSMRRIFDGPPRGGRRS
jgi:hypothetical protein